MRSNISITFVEQKVQASSTEVGISSKIKNLVVIFDQTLAIHVNIIVRKML